MLNDCFANCRYYFINMMEITKIPSCMPSCFLFLVITLIWNLHLRMPETLVWFKQKMTNKMDYHLTGLYINPNELFYTGNS